MKKLFKSFAALAVCFALVASTTASAVTPSYAPYEGYEYNSYEESTAAPIGYLPSNIVSGSDLDFSVKVSSVTDICLDAHDTDYYSMFLLDSVGGVVYKTDTSLNIKSIFNNFTTQSGKAVSLKGAKLLACDFTNAYFYVYKSGKIYIISSLSKVVKTLNVGNVVTMATYAAPVGDNYDTYLLVTTSNAPGNITIYSHMGKRVGSVKAGTSIKDISISSDAGNILALDASANRIVKLMADTDMDDDGNEIVTGFSVDSRLKANVNLTGATAISSDSSDLTYYLTMPDNRIACVDSESGDVSYITKSSIPSNVSVRSTNYTNLCVATDTDTIYALSNDKGPEISSYNSKKGFLNSDYSLSTTLTNPSDMLYKGKYIYILDSGNSRILKLDRDLTKVLGIYANFHNKKKGYLSFYGAKGFTVDNKENFYIADTENHRVLVSDNKGNVRLIITRPDQQLADTDAPFRATKVLLDRKDQIYVICDSINLGALVFDMDGKFLNFFGSNTVQATAEVLLQFIRKRFMTREQLKANFKITPIALTNFDIDADGFIYTVTETDQTQRNTTFTSMLRRLNYQGDNVFELTDNTPGFGDFEWDRQQTTTNTSFCDVDVDKDGYVNLIDSGRGKIFQYTDDGNLVTVFGGFSAQKGTFSEPVAVESVGDKIYVLDRTDNNITVFKPTGYANALRKAFALLDSSDADAALAAWSAVIKYNTNNQYSYYGMGRAYEMKNDYENAMKYFKLANARGGYSKSYKEYRKSYIHDNIWWMALVVIAVVVLLALLSKYLKKKMVAKHGEAYSPLETKWGMPIYTILHPVDGFEQFRTRNIESVPIAIGLVICWFLVRVVQFFFTGFAYNSNRSIDYDLVANVVGTVGLYVLFVIANWAVCTLVNGKGRMKEILCVTAYSLTPMLITSLINVVLSNNLSLDEAAFISIVNMIGMIWSLAMLLLGLYTIHQYSFAGTIGTTFLTVVGMLIIGLLAVLFFTLLQQCFSFFVSLVDEVKLR